MRDRSLLARDPALTPLVPPSAPQVNSPKRDWIGFQIVVSVGMGILYAAPQFPILASLPTSKTAHALSFFTFVRPARSLSVVSARSTDQPPPSLRSAPSARSGASLCVLRLCRAAPPV